MSVFNDDDLKRLKEYHSIDREFHANSIWVERNYGSKCECGFSQTHEACRKACGK
jgi:hypothetical protein